jgi:chromosomal replication initiator protein
MYNPLFIYGGWVSARPSWPAPSATAANRRRRDAQGHLHVERELRERADGSLDANRMGEARGADARLLDDVESLAGSERTQEELFHTFDSLHAATTGFIHQSARSESQLTSDKFGVTSPGSSAANRFECALTADIAAPDLETRVAILKKRVAYDDLLLPSEVAHLCRQEHYFQGARTRRLP